jgi:hypothetical protein
MRSALACCVAQHDIDVTAVKAAKFLPRSTGIIQFAPYNCTSLHFLPLIDFSFCLSLTKLSTKIEMVLW